MVTNNNYEIKCIDEELGIFSVRKKNEDKEYILTKLSDGGFKHVCKATSVYGNNYICRHKKMIMKEFFTNKAHKHIFNLTPKRKQKGESQGA